MLELANITSIKYTGREAEMSIASLSQGEVDVLNQAREALGWPSIKSLAFKYYPAFPCRKWWLEALRRTQRLARRVNIVYLLKCLQSIQEEWQEVAFSGKPVLNRLIHKATNKVKSNTNRLESTNGNATFRGRLGPYQRVVLAGMGGLMG
jgi:hypothetical protein